MTNRDEPASDQATLRCMWCENWSSYAHAYEVGLYAPRNGWHDINRVEDGDPGEFQGTCPQCIWEHAASHHQAVS